MYVTLCENCKSFVNKQCELGRLEVFRKRGEVENKIVEDGKADFRNIVPVIQRICNAFVNKDVDVTIDQIKEALKFNYTLIIQTDDLAEANNNFVAGMSQETTPKEVVICTSLKNSKWINSFPPATRFEFYIENHLTWPKNVKAKHVYFVGEGNKISSKFLNEFIKSLNEDLDYLIYKEETPTAFIFNFNTYTKIKSLESLKALQNEKSRNNNLSQELPTVPEISD